MDNAISVTQGQKQLAIILISSAEGQLAVSPLDILAEWPLWATYSHSPFQIHL